MSWKSKLHQFVKDGLRSTQGHLYSSALEDACDERRFFATASGRIGPGPAQIQIADSSSHRSLTKHAWHTQHVIRNAPPDLSAADRTEHNELASAIPPVRMFELPLRMSSHTWHKCVACSSHEVR